MQSRASAVTLQKLLQQSTDLAPGAAHETHVVSHYAFPCGHNRSQPAPRPGQCQTLAVATKDSTPPVVQIGAVSTYPELPSLLDDALTGFMSNVFFNRSGVARKNGDHYDFKDITELEASPQELEVYQFFAKLVERDQLRVWLTEVYEFVARLPVLASQLARTRAENLGYHIPGANDAIRALVKMRGLTAASREYFQRKGYAWSDWQNLSRLATQKIDQAGIPADGSLSVDDPSFLDRFAHLAGTRFVESTRTELLIDGPASFKKRDEMIGRAKRSIDVVVWALQDELTGELFKNEMIQKAREGIKVRLMVDNKVSQFLGYGARVTDLERAGIEVVRWDHPEADYLIQHRKIMFVDGEAYVAGGINIGDKYSHLNPDRRIQRWRDTDVYVEGPAAIEAYRLFAKLWNEQLEWFPQRYPRHQRVEMPAEPQAEPSASTKPKVALIESVPGPWAPGGTPILHAMMAAIRGARQSVDIENAYVVLNPALRGEIASALARGVKVRVLTNSDISVDEAAVSKAIMKWARELKRMGAGVFLKKGHTLHSKVMIVDRRLGMVKSYNLHPRSERIDTEIALVFDDPAFGRTMTEMFERDISRENALEVTDHRQVRYHTGTFMEQLLLTLTMRIGYDAL